MHNYWAQFSASELDSMHGIERGLDNRDLEDQFDELMREESEDEEYDEEGGPITMESLGISWRDFM